jgi:hypothetical protein
MEKTLISSLTGWTAKHFVKPNHPALRTQIAAMLNAFFAIRGRSTLSNDETAVVMRRAFETFVTADSHEIENPRTVIAMVCLRNIESYQEFKRAQCELTLNHLADEVTEELLRQVTKYH